MYDDNEESKEIRKSNMMNATLKPSRKSRYSEQENHDPKLTNCEEARHKKTIIVLESIGKPNPF